MLDNPDDVTQSVAYGINNDGVIVGYGYSNDALYQPQIWDGGVSERLPLPEGYTQGTAWGINDAGQIIGTVWDDTNSGDTSVVWQGGDVIVLDMLPDFSFSQVDTISADGTIVGYVYDDTVSVPVVWRVTEGESPSSTPRINWMTGKPEEATPVAN
jgi:uncharacterized membrane protein